MLASELVRRRLAAGLTQRELADASGVSQPNIAAYERGRRPLTDSMAERLEPHLAVRPSRLLAEHRREVTRLAAEHGAVEVRVFGSVARGTDEPASDIDLLVRMQPGRTIFDLALLREDLAELLGRRVDVVSEGALRGRGAEVLAEAVPL